MVDSFEAQVDQIEPAEREDAVSTIQEAERRTVLDADATFFQALLKSDRATLESLLAPDFLIVDVSAGNVTKRADFLGAIASVQVAFESIESFPEHAVVREFGPVAVVVGTTSMRFKVPGGRLVRRSQPLHARFRARRRQLEAGLGAGNRPARGLTSAFVGTTWRQPG